MVEGYSINKDEYVYKKQSYYRQTDGQNNYKIDIRWLEETSTKNYTFILNRSRENHVSPKKLQKYRIILNLKRLGYC